MIIRRWGTSLSTLALLLAAIAALAVFAPALADDEPDYQDTSWWHGGRECRNTGTEEIEWPSGDWIREYYVCVEEDADYWAFYTYRDEHIDPYDEWDRLVEAGTKKTGNVDEERAEGNQPKESEHSQSADGEEECDEEWEHAPSFWSPAPTTTEQYYSSGSLRLGDAYYSTLAGYSNDPYWR